MQFLAMIPDLLKLLFMVFNEVHTVQSALPGAPGAEKSQAVIDKVTPIAAVIGAEVPHIQSLINVAVDMFKSAKVGAFAPAAGAQEAP
jgi:hypothetical protein